jgi:predicted regulator of Ras-like GTPase activity (Roadblock/LC7/MglB family)
VAWSNERELHAWKSRTLIGCLHEFRRNTDAVCALIVQDDASILAKVSTDSGFDADTLGVFSSMMFAISRLLVQELGTEGKLIGRITIGTEYNLLVMSVTANIALIALSRISFAKGVLEYQARIIIPRIINCLVDMGSKNL